MFDCLCKYIGGSLCVLGGLGASGVECRFGEWSTVGCAISELGMKRPGNGGYVAGFGTLDMTFVCAAV